MVLPTLENALASLEKSQVPEDIARVFGGMGIAGSEATRLAQYCTGERLERTGRAACAGVSVEPEAPVAPLTIVGLLERVTS